MVFNVYIDGYNLYYAIRRASQADPYYKRCYWLDIERVGKWIQDLYPNWTLGAVKFFTSRVDSKDDGFRNQETYWKALRTKKSVEIIEGSFRKESMMCRFRNCEVRGLFDHSREKMTDVALGVTMLKDACLKQVGAIVLVTRDIDQVPALQALAEAVPSVPRVIAYPPGPDDLPQALKAAASAREALPNLAAKDWRGDTRLTIKLSMQVLDRLRLASEFKIPNEGKIREPEDWTISEDIRRAGPTLMDH